MSKKFLPLAAVLAAVLASLPAEPASAYPDGPPNQATWCGNQGSTAVCSGGNCTNCSACHWTYAPPNPPATGGSVTLQNLPATYRPGQQYTLGVLLDDAQNAQFIVAGFEVSALRRDGLCQAGDLAVSSPDTRVDVDGATSTQWLKHTRPQDQVGGTAMWEFLWTAPTAGTGEVAMNVCANAANDGDGPANDRIYCAEAILAEETSVPLPEPALMVARSGPDLQMEWTETAEAFHLYAGPLEQVGSMVSTSGNYRQVACNFTGNAAPVMGGVNGSGSEFFLIVAAGAGAEGAYGCTDLDADGACDSDRVAAASPCP